MDFPYSLIYKNIRNAYAKVQRDWTILFTIPNRLKWNEKFLSEFLKKWEELYIKYNKKETLESKNEDWVLIFWERVSWSDFFDNWKIYSEQTKEKKLKEILYDYSIERIEKYSTTLWAPYKSLTIRKMKSRRGSCNWNQDIVLNLQLVHLPQKYIQYVCAHECAHLIEKNHSDRFRSVVETLFKNCKKIRKEMRSFILK